MAEYLKKPVVGEFVMFSKKCARIVSVSETQFRTETCVFRRCKRTGEYTTGTDFSRSWAFIPTPEQIAEVVAAEQAADARKAAFAAKAVTARDLLARVNWSTVADGHAIHIAEMLGLVKET